MSSKFTGVTLVLLFALLAAFFIPVHGALYLDLSAFDFLTGALSGGNWSASRCILLVVFCAILLAIAWCIVRIAALRRS